jgi:hypothetical protein
MGLELEKISSGSRIDWVAVKEAYVCGTITDDGSLYFPTHVELATRFNASPTAIAAKSSEGSWSLERSTYVANLEQRKKEKRIEELASQAAEFDTRVLKAARAGISHIEAQFRAAQKLYETDGIMMRLNALDSISRSLERYHRVGRLALGESTHNVASETHTWLELLNVLDEKPDE